MKSKFFLIALVFSLFSLINAAIPPCSQQEFIDSSDYVVEGYVVNLSCGEPFNYGICEPFSGQIDFKYGRIAHCEAEIEVTKNLKGNYNIGDKVTISFSERVDYCNGSDGMQPGYVGPVDHSVIDLDLQMGSYLRYYDSEACTQRNPNIEEIGEPREIKQDNLEKGKIEHAQYVIPLVILFILFGIVYWFYFNKGKNI